MNQDLQREVMLHWAERQQWKQSESRLKGIAEEIAELIFWGITSGRDEKSVRLRRKEK